MFCVTKIDRELKNPSKNLILTNTELQHIIGTYNIGFWLDPVHRQWLFAVRLYDHHYRSATSQHDKRRWNTATAVGRTDVNNI